MLCHIPQPISAFYVGAQHESAKPIRLYQLRRRETPEPMDWDWTSSSSVENWPSFAETATEPSPSLLAASISAWSLPAAPFCHRLKAPESIATWDTSSGSSISPRLDLPPLLPRHQFYKTSRSPFLYCLRLEPLRPFACDASVFFFFQFIHVPVTCSRALAFLMGDGGRQEPGVSRLADGLPQKPALGFNSFWQIPDKIQNSLKVCFLWITRCTELVGQMWIGWVLQ